MVSVSACISMIFLVSASRNYAMTKLRHDDQTSGRQDDTRGDLLKVDAFGACKLVFSRAGEGAD